MRITVKEGTTSTMKFYADIKSSKHATSVLMDLYMPTASNTPGSTRLAETPTLMGLSKWNYLI